MNAAEVLAHFREKGVLADISEHNVETPRFIIASAPLEYAKECMEPLSNSNKYFEGLNRIDSVTDDGVLVSMYIEENT